MSGIVAPAIPSCPDCDCQLLAVALKTRGCRLSNLEAPESVGQNGLHLTRARTSASETLAEERSVISGAANVSCSIAHQLHRLLSECTPSALTGLPGHSANTAPHRRCVA